MIANIKKCTVKAFHNEVLARSFSNVKSPTNCYWTTNAKTLFPRTISSLETLERQKPHYERHDINSVYPNILRALTETINKYNQSETSKWLTKALEYNLRKSPKNLVLRTVLTYEHLALTKNLEPEKLKLAYILGWCAEILNTSALMFDDVMDNGTLRRGQPCWYTLEHVGLKGLNDAILVENSVYIILKKYCRNLDCYADLMDLFHEVAYITICGKNLDMSRASTPVNEFNMSTYKTMAVNKATYDNFYLPFASALHLTGNKTAFTESKAIIHDIGLFFQIQNDFLDCFGTPEVIGKIGTDIQDKKYSWLATVCMERANEEQKQIMKNCYGKKDPLKVQRVKELYELLDLPILYANYEEDSYNRIKSRIQQTSSGVPHEIFLDILNKTYGRESKLKLLQVKHIS